MNTAPTPSPAAPAALALLAGQPATYVWKDSLLLLAQGLHARLHALAGAGPAPTPEGAALLAQLDQYYRAPAPEAAAPAWTLPLPEDPACQPLQGLPAPAQLAALLALLPHLLPGLLDQLVLDLLPAEGEAVVVGGVRTTHSPGLLPTGDTALLLLAGTNLAARQAAYHDVFGPDRPLARAGLLALAPVPAGEPAPGGRLVLLAPALELLATGRVRPPVLGPDFPAQPLTCRLTWDELVLPPATAAALADLTAWLHHHHALRQRPGLARARKPGFRALFYGPPGTGKSLTAALLGQHARRPVFRVDLALLTSKYIGETEKNLARLFHRAHAQDWILFFDEAEALFAKRSEGSDAPDRFANQLVAYLLQKIEDHPGLVILASNLKNNLDPAFARRFQALVHFPLPAPAQRLALWQQALPAPALWGPGLDPAQLAQRYELSGAAILNVVQLATLRALDRQAAQPADTQPADADADALVSVQLADLLDGIRLEGQKEGRLL